LYIHFIIRKVKAIYLITISKTKVGKQFIQKIESQEIELKNGFLVPIGRSYKETLNSLYEN